MKRRSEVDSWNGGISMNDKTHDDSNIIKSPSLQRGNTTSWISPFSQRKLKKTRSVFHMQGGQINITNCEMGPKNEDKVYHFLSIMIHRYLKHLHKPE